MTNLEVKEDGLIYVDGILVSDQEKARELIIRKGSISRDKDGFYQPIVGVHPIPDLDWVNGNNYPCIEKGDCQEPGENGWKCLHTCKRQHLVAILKESTPSTEQESQEELWNEAQNFVKNHLGTYSNDLVCDLARWAIEEMKKHYIITRKP